MKVIVWNSQGSKWEAAWASFVSPQVTAPPSDDVLLLLVDAGWAPWVLSGDVVINNGYSLTAGVSSFNEKAAGSRLNFLEVLRAGHPNYVINTEALAYMRERALAGPIIDQLAAQSERHFPDQVAWEAHLERLGIAALTVRLDPVRIATKGALWGAIQAHGLLPETVIVSDGAGQFAIGLHGLCWVHAERLVHKLETFTDLQRTAQRRIRALTWWFYADLKVYRRELTRRRRADLRAVRPPIPPPHRLCRPGSAARAAARQQVRAVAGARVPRDPAAHERLGERQLRSGHSAQGQRRNPQQYRTRLPGCVLGPVENLPETRSVVLGLPRCQARHPRPANHPLPS